MDRGYYSYENYKNCIAKISCNSINPDKIQIQQRKVKINVKLSITFYFMQNPILKKVKKAYEKLINEFLEKMSL